MKSTITILATVFTLSASVLFAGNETYPTSAVIDNTPITLTSLAPVLPMEATFEDIAGEQLPVTGLAPVTPATADFE